MSFRDSERLSRRNLTNVFIRLPLATFVIHTFSHALFSQQVVKLLIRLFTVYPYFQFEGRAVKDVATIQKMSRFWPPHKGFGLGEISLAFTITLVLFLRLIDLPTVTQSLFGFRCKSKLLNFLITPIYASFIPFVVLIPMMRIAEMHLFVLFLNWLHITLSFYVVYFVWYFLKSTSVADEKTEKTE